MKTISYFFQKILIRIFLQRLSALHDPKRIKYLNDHISQLLRAKREGVDVRGYFVWTFLDNFEWAEGYYPRFGLVYVDFDTQKRIVKSSGHWYAKFLKSKVPSGVVNISNTA